MKNIHISKYQIDNFQELLKEHLVQLNKEFNDINLDEEFWEVIEKFKKEKELRSIL